MKKIACLLIPVVLALLVAACDSDNAPNCLQTAGPLTVQLVDVEPFTKVTVFQRTRLVVKQGPVQQVRVETGKNLLNDLKIEVIDNRLVIKNENACNLVRDYGLTTIYITTPDLTEIRTSTGEDIRSDGVLAFNNLTLLSEDTAQEDAFNTEGDFRLELNVQNLTIVGNNLSNFYLNGTATQVDFTFLEGDGTIQAQDLVIQNAQIFHRGTNLWQLDVRQRISGTI